MAHLVAAEGAHQQLGLEVVSFLPAGDPWQKRDRRVTDAATRVEMVRLATAGVPYFEVDDRELTRQGPTYTIDTLDTFAADDELVLVMGSDAARGLPTWHRWEEVVAGARIAVMGRPGTDDAEVEKAIGPVEWLDVPPLSLSGTGLREMAGKGLSLRFLVPDAVREFIEANELYG